VWGQALKPIFEKFPLTPRKFGGGQTVVSVTVKTSEIVVYLWGFWLAA